MTESEYVLAPNNVSVQFELNEVVTLLFSMLLLNEAEYTSGLADWIVETARTLTPEQKLANRIVTHTIEGTKRPSPTITFPQFTQQVAQWSDEQTVDAALAYVIEGGKVTREEALASREVLFDAVLAHMKDHWAELKKDHEPEVDEEYWGFLYDHLQQPAQLRDFIVNHMTFMWDNHIQEEWRHVYPTMREAYQAYSALSYGEMTPYEAVETVTGRDFRGLAKFEWSVTNMRHIRFVPSPHLGPYVGWGPFQRGDTMLFLFTPRPPKNQTATSPNLSRSELLVRLNALADDTRLRILELLTRHDELCAQDFINELDLSQSSASRHLRQLTASGYLSERRRDVAKCYSLNPERIEDTITSLRAFLSPQ